MNDFLESHPGLFNDFFQQFSNLIFRGLLNILSNIYGRAFLVKLTNGFIR